MTTVELATIGLRYATDRDLSSLTVEESLGLVDSMNRSIQTFFQKAPDIYKRTTVSQLIKESERVEFTATSGATTIGENAFLSSQRGCTLILDGEDNQNEIVDTNKILLPHKGVTGTVSGTIYYDVVAFKDFLLERVVSDPVVVETDCVLRNTSQWQTSTDAYRSPWFDRVSNRGIGSYPEYYRIQYVGGSIQVDNDAIFQLRLDPIPTTKCVLRFDADIRPIPYTIEDLETPANLPIPSSVAHRTIVPIFAASLVGSAVWEREKDMVEIAWMREGRAMEDIMDLPEKFGATQGKVRTAYGY